MIDIYPIFPVAVGATSIGKISDRVKTFVSELEYRPSVFNQTSKNTNILDAPEMAELKPKVEEAIASYFKQTVNTTEDCGLRITQSWAAKTENDQGHHIHNHPNSIFSGVFYVNVSEGDEIRFHKHHRYSNLTPESYAETNEYNATYYNFGAHEGVLYIFPSELTHEVLNRSGKDKTRISVAFNTFYTGTIGNDAALTKLVL
jgi:uncharacterized protein (TIGR02466 family)